MQANETKMGLKGVYRDFESWNGPRVEFKVIGMELKQETFGSSAISQVI